MKELYKMFVPTNEITKINTKSSVATDEITKINTGLRF